MSSLDSGQLTAVAEFLNRLGEAAEDLGVTIDDHFHVTIGDNTYRIERDYINGMYSLVADY